VGAIKLNYSDHIHKGSLKATTIAIHYGTLLISKKTCRICNKKTVILNSKLLPNREFQTYLFQFTVRVQLILERLSMQT